MIMLVLPFPFTTPLVALLSLSHIARPALLSLSHIARPVEQTFVYVAGL